MNGKSILKISSGARRIGSLIKNEECERKDYALFKGISLAQVAALFGYTPDRVSVNAINRGNAVEKYLCENDGLVVRDLLVQTAVLGSHEQHFVDLNTLIPKTTPHRQSEIQKYTYQFFDQKLRGDENAPNIIANATPNIRIGNQTRNLQIDLLVAKDSERFYRVFEIKIYADRGYGSDHEKIASARAQMAVYQVSIEQYLQKRATIIPINYEAGLILTKPTTYKTPTLRLTSIEEEVNALKTALRKRKDIVQRIEGSFPPRFNLNDPKVWHSIPYNFEPSKCSFCDMRKACRRQAMTDKSLTLLSPNLRRINGIVANTDELWRLVQHQQSPRTPEQVTVQSHLSRLYQQLRRLIS